MISALDADAVAAWGQVAGAIGTFLAVVVAVGIAIRDGRYRDAERRDNEASHARLVSGFRATDPPALTIGYTNFGACPVTSVRLIEVVGRHGDVTSTGWSVNGSTEQYVLAVIAPGATVLTPPITVTWPEAHDGHDLDPVEALYYPTIVFVDANGRWWRRTAHDPPERLLEQPSRVSRLTRRRPDPDT